MTQKEQQIIQWGSFVGTRSQITKKMRQINAQKKDAFFECSEITYKEAMKMTEDGKISHLGLAVSVRPFEEYFYLKVFGPKIKTAMSQSHKKEVESATATFILVRTEPDKNGEIIAQGYYQQMKDHLATIVQFQSANHYELERREQARASRESTFHIAKIIDTLPSMKDRVILKLEQQLDELLIADVSPELKRVEVLKLADQINNARK